MKIKSEHCDRPTILACPSLMLCVCVCVCVFKQGQCRRGTGQVLWAYTGRNKTLPPSTSLPVMGKIAGVNTASLGTYLHSKKKRARWAAGFYDDLNGHVFDLDREGLRQVVFCP